MGLSSTNLCAEKKCILLNTKKELQCCCHHYLSWKITIKLLSITILLVFSSSERDQEGFKYLSIPICSPMSYHILRHNIKVRTHNIVDISKIKLSTCINSGILNFVAPLTTLNWKGSPILYLPINLESPMVKSSIQLYPSGCDKNQPCRSQCRIQAARRSP